VTRLAVLDFEQERRPAVPMEHLGRVHTVPACDLAGLEHIEDGSRMGAITVTLFIAESLPEPAASGWGLRFNLLMISSAVSGLFMT